MRGLPEAAAKSRRPPWNTARLPRRRPGTSPRPGPAALGAGAPGRLPGAVPGQAAVDPRHRSCGPGPQAGGRPCAPGTGAAAQPALCRAVPGGVQASSVTAPSEAARPTGGHPRSPDNCGGNGVDVAPGWGWRRRPATAERRGGTAAGRTASSPGPRGRTVSQGPLGRHRRRGTRRRQMDRDPVAGSLAIGWRRSITKPTAWAAAHGA